MQVHELLVKLQSLDPEAEVVVRERPYAHRETVDAALDDYGRVMITRGWTQGDNVISVSTLQESDLSGGKD